MIKQLMALTGALAFAVAPVQARVETRTGDLLRLLDEYGVDVQINPADKCAGAMGRFAVGAADPIIQICYKSKSPTAADHDTVRHETWHYLQWCKNPNSLALLPLHKDRHEYSRFVLNALSDTALERIDSSYPERVRAIEYEAFAAANTYSAQTLMAMVRRYCTPV